MSTWGCLAPRQHQQGVRRRAKISMGGEEETEEQIAERRKACKQAQQVSKGAGHRRDEGTKSRWYVALKE